MKDHYYFDYEVEQLIIKLHKSQLLGSDIFFELRPTTNLSPTSPPNHIAGSRTGKTNQTRPNRRTSNRTTKTHKSRKGKTNKSRRSKPSGKKEKELPPITEDEIPFELPEGWVWCRLGEVSTNAMSVVGCAFEVLT